MTDGALSGLTVLELGHFVAVPWCGRFFAGLGATVIKVEDPGTGDKARRAGPFPGDVPDPEKSGLFLYLNTNKKSVTLNLRMATGRDMFLDLVRRADVVLTGLRPEELAALNLDYRQLRAANPRVIHVAVTPFGWDGPWSNWKGNDFTSWHSGGVGYETPSGFVTDPEKHHPLKGPEYQADVTTGWTAASAGMVALQDRERTGEGQFVDVSAQEAVANMVRPAVGRLSFGGEQLPRVTTRGARYYRAKDGFVQIGLTSDGHWRNFVRMLGEPEWAQLEIFNDPSVRNQSEEIQVFIEEFTAQHTKRELFEMCQARHVPCFPFQTVEEILKSEQYDHRGFWSQVSHPVAGAYLYPGAGYRFSATPATIEQPAPLLGQHNEDVLGGMLGYSREMLRMLHESGITGPEARSAYSIPAPVLPAEPETSLSAGHDKVDSRSRLPLEGIRVIDFGLVLAVPHATQWLAVLGAEVIKVESKTHLDIHRTNPSITFMADRVSGPNRGSTFNSLHYGKKSCCINMATPEGRELARSLVADADVVTENFTTEVATRFGLTYDNLCEVKPDIILLSMSSMGRTGPLKDSVGFGPSNLAYSGLPVLTGYEGSKVPMFLGGTWPDFHIGTSMPALVLAALRHRSRTGQGQWIDISMCEMMSASIPQAILDFQMNGRLRKPQGNRDNMMAPHNVYRCAGNDQWVAITAETEEEWAAFCSAAGYPEWRSDPRFQDAYRRQQHIQELDALMTSWTRTLSPGVIANLLQEAGVPAAPCLNASGLVSNPQLLHRSFFVTPVHAELGARRVMGVPVRYGAVPEKRITGAPVLDQDDDYVYKELLHLSDGDVERLAAAKVLY